MGNIQKFYSAKETQYLTHSFHLYPNKFIPQIARALIEEYSNKNDLILDPFCGSGTVLVEASLLKRNSIGIDLNPLACLIARVKTTPIEINKLRETTNKLLNNLHFNLNKENNLNDFIDKIQPQIPNFPKREKWFQKEALTGLSILKELINEIEDEKIRNFCLVAFSSIIKPVSNASSVYRLTRDKEKDITEMDVYHLFQKKVTKMMEIMQAYHAKTKQDTTIYQKDSRQLWDFPQVDFVVTNPPKFNFEFQRSFCIYFWWLPLGQIPSQVMIGNKRNHRKLVKLQTDFIDELTKTISEKKKCIGVALSQYFYDLKLVLFQMFRLLKEDKYCCVQASDFVLYGKDVRVVDIFVALAQQVGFKLEKRIQRIIPKKAFIYAKEDRIEEILVLKK